MQRWLRYLIAVLLIVATEAQAQERHTLSRAALDSLVNPPLSTTARGSLLATPETFSFGEIGDQERVNAIFTLRNCTDEAIEIMQMRSSCSCLRLATTIERIEAGTSATLRAEFNPAGRSGSFSIPIFIYSALDTLRPTLRLVVEGRVVSTDEWSHLPVTMGQLRLSRSSVLFNDGATTERIAIANTSNRAMRLSAHTTLEGLTLRTEPEVLQAGEEGDIVISYAPKNNDIAEVETIVIIEGCGTARPSERMIKITIKR